MGTVYSRIQPTPAKNATATKIGATKRMAIFEHIDGYYFNTRRHQNLDYRTPREVEESYFAKLTLDAGGV